MKRTEVKQTASRKYNAILYTTTPTVYEVVVRRYIDFYSSLGCDVILTSVWGHVQKWAGRWRVYFGYDVSEIGLHVNLSMIFCFALRIRGLKSFSRLTNYVS